MIESWQPGKPDIRDHSFLHLSQPYLTIMYHMFNRSLTCTVSSSDIQLINKTCPHVKTARAEGDDMWSIDSSWSPAVLSCGLLRAICYLADTQWSVDIEGYFLFSRHTVVCWGLFATKAVYKKRAATRMSGRRRAFSGSPVSRSRAVKFSPPRSYLLIWPFWGKV